MKSTSIAAYGATALSLLQSRDPAGFEKLFQYLTPSSLRTLQDCLCEALDTKTTSGTHPGWQSLSSTEKTQCCNEVVAEAVLRRLVFKCLRKYSTCSTPQTMEEALKHHTLPKSLKEELVERYGGDPPNTWYDALQRLKVIADNNADQRNPGLWELVLDHPMTAYVPVQCQSCGLVVPDDLNSDLTDEQVGLREEEPTDEEAPLVRSGWFRGPRPHAKVFVLTCTECGVVSRWFRSRDPYVILNAQKWGRLCGEQEDLRLDLANYLDSHPNVLASGLGSYLERVQ
ncbi:hypothetical protein IV203_032988 [Nitzschia inconspicua]|uniref:Uncharacterized protein n=1 Tax=Nitzschia inconspicua TaxID=303405 RepID=A0A9K3KKN4_9STRA|nr:hypothetical protein IV203_032988 [Nitzschia inconspicua]